MDPIQERFVRERQYRFLDAIQDACLSDPFDSLPKLQKQFHISRAESFGVYRGWLQVFVARQEARAKAKRAADRLKIMNGTGGI